MGLAEELEEASCLEQILIVTNSSLWVKGQDTRDSEIRPEMMKIRARVIALEMNDLKLKLL